MFSKGIVGEERFQYQGKHKSGTFTGRVHWNGEIYGRQKTVYFQVKPSHGRFEIRIGIDKDGLIKGTTPSNQGFYELNADVFNRLYRQIVG